VHLAITSQVAAVVTCVCCRANSEHPINHTTRYHHNVVGYGLDVPGSIPDRDIEFVFSRKVRSGCGIHPVSYSVSTAASSLGVKAVGA
jgi:hypothetical protein